MSPITANNLALKFTTVPSKRLAESITASATSFRLSDIEGWNAADLAAADFGTELYAIFRDANSTVLEIMEIDPDTIASSNITIVRRGLNYTGDLTTEDSARKLSWVRGSTIVELGAPTPQLFQWLKEYIDDASIAGAVPATDTTAGIVRIATSAQIDADTATEDGYALSTTSDQLVLSKYGTRLPTADQKAALDGAQGEPSATSPYITTDKLSQSTTDQSQTTQNSSTAFGEANTTGLRNKVGQSFIAGKTKIRGVTLYKNADTGTFIGTVTIALQADNSGSPSGSDLATITISNNEWRSKPVGEFEAIFSAEYGALTVGSLYWLVPTSSTSDTSNHPNFGINTAGGYANGTLKYNNTTDGWVTATGDLYFKTLEGNANQAPLTESDGKLPAIFIDLYEDFSLPHFQVLPAEYSNAAGFARILATTSNTSGSVVFMVYDYSNDTIIIRYERQRGGGYLATHKDTINFGFTEDSTYSIGAVVIGSYAYIIGRDNGIAIGVRRYDIANLGNETGCTISGTSVSTTVDKLAYTDGTFIYIFDTGSTWNKYSISGTTLTFVSAVTSADADGGGNDKITGTVFDGYSVYMFRQSDVSASYYSPKELLKYSPDGTILLNTVTYSADMRSQIFTSLENGAGLIVGVPDSIIYLCSGAKANTASTDGYGLSMVIRPVNNV